MTRQVFQAHSCNNNNFITRILWEKKKRFAHFSLQLAQAAVFPCSVDSHCDPYNRRDKVNWFATSLLNHSWPRMHAAKYQPIFLIRGIYMLKQSVTEKEKKRKVVIFLQWLWNQLESSAKVPKRCCRHSMPQRRQSQTVCLKCFQWEKWRLTVRGLLYFDLYSIKGWGFAN